MSGRSAQLLASTAFLGACALFVTAAHAQDSMVDRAGPPSPVDAGVALEPPALTMDSPARYPKELAAAPIAGEVELELLIDAEGQIAQAHVITATDDAFAREALHAAPSLQFSPARVNGVATPAQVRFKYQFQIPAPKPAPAATVLLRGLVRSMGSREPIIGATVYTKDIRGPDTDAEGRFTFELPVGQHDLYVRGSGYIAKSFREDLRRAASVDVVYLLEPERVNRFETVVRGERERTELARVSLEGPELTEIAGTGGDPFRVVMLLPGVSGTISGLSYPVVRGASPASTGYYLDGVRVPQIYHLFLGPAVVHPDFIEGVDFYAGGAPAQYGRLLGGVVEGRISRPHDGKFKGSAYIDLLNAGGFVEVPFDTQATQVTLAGRFSYTGWLLGLVSKAVAPGGEKVVLDFWDYQVRIEQKVASGKLRLFVFGSYDKFGVEAPPPTATALQGVQFHRFDARYRHPMWTGEGELAVTWGDDKFSFITDGALTDEAGVDLGTQRTDFSIGQQSYSVRGKWSRSWGEKWQASTGATFDGIAASAALNITVTPPGGPSVARTVEFPIASGHFTGVWAQTTWKDYGFGVTFGLRTDAYHLRPSVTLGSVDPRLSVKYQLTPTLELRGSAGLYHQPPTFLIPLPVIDLASLRWNLQEVLQSSVGVKWKFAGRFELSVDGYVNPMIRTLEISIGGETAPTGPRPPGGGQFDLGATSAPGMAYGLEVMLRAPMEGRWFGWVSYSLQRSTRRQTFARTADGQFVEDVTANLPYAFEQVHVLNAVASYRFDTGITLGAVFHFNTGRPESGDFGSRTRVLVDDVDPLTGRSGKVWRLVDKDQVDRLPSYFRLDLRAAKTWTFDNFFLELYLDVLNATLSQEVLGFDYLLRSENGVPVKRAQQIPVIVPSLGLKGRF
jgi:TonB family protein